MPSNKASTQHDEDITNGDQDDIPNYASTSREGRTPVNDLLQMIATQQKLLVDLLQKMSTSAVTQQESQFDRMARRIDKFSYASDQDDCFNSWYNTRTLEANFKGIRHETLECLALVFALQAPELADHRIRFLRRLDEDERITINDLAKEYHAWKSVKDDSRTVEVFNAPEVRAVRKKKRHHQSSTAKARAKAPPSICQQNHWKKHYPQNRHATTATQQSKATSQRRTKQSSPRTWYQRLIGRTTDVQKYLKVHINGHPTRLQLDTGADVTIISRPTWMQLGGPQLQKTSDTLRGANGLPLRSTESSMPLSWSLTTEERLIPDKVYVMSLMTTICSESPGLSKFRISTWSWRDPTFGRSRHLTTTRSETRGNGAARVHLSHVCT
nr:Peptidase A2A domain containing protein [Haemonchus contortus]